MATIETKFTVGDQIYYVPYFPDFENMLEISDMFEEVNHCIETGTIAALHITGKGTTYLIDNNKELTENAIKNSVFATRKEAYFHILNSMKKQTEEILLNIKTIAENTADFDKVYQEALSENN